MPRRKKQPEIVNEADIEKIRESLTKTNIKLKKVALTEKQLQLLKIIFDNESKIIFISGPAELVRHLSRFMVRFSFII